MSKFLQKMKNVIAGRRGSDSSKNGDEFDIHAGDGPGSPYHPRDYGTRFGSYEVKPRPGTYGSGDYAHTRTSSRGYGGDYRPRLNPRTQSFPANGYGSSPARTCGSDTGERVVRGFDDDAAAGSRYIRGPESGDGWYYGYDSRGRKGFMPLDRAQRGGW
ncbi:hypothetical protein BDW74DRAFT_83729 [Aspergillus multicolor]|uniref:uncharacterized protein n=1 Tax=Aspergillus multicolor TaxID=41759 RepID=UPI003CCCE997